MGVLEGKIKFHGSVGEEKDCTLEVENMPEGNLPEAPNQEGIYGLYVNENGGKFWEDYTEALDFADYAGANFPLEEQGTYVVNVGANKIVHYVKIPDLPTAANRYALRVDAETGALSWDALDEF